MTHYVVYDTVTVNVTVPIETRTRLQKKHVVTTIYLWLWHSDIDYDTVIKNVLSRLVQPKPGRNEEMNAESVQRGR